MLARSSVRRPGKYVASDDRRPRCAQTSRRRTPPGPARLEIENRLESIVILFFGGYGIPAGAREPCSRWMPQVQQEPFVRSDACARMRLRMT